MKKTIIIIILIFNAFPINAQNSSWGNPDYLSLYSQFLKRIDTVQLKKNDIEVRLWFHDGKQRVTTISFVSLIKHNHKWNASYYTFTGIPKRKKGVIIFDSVCYYKKEPAKLNYDSLYKQLVKDNILTLNSDSIYVVMDKKGQHEWMFLHAGPTNYTVQILINGKRRTLNYRCPKYFYHEAKIDEFEFPLKVISSLLKIMEIKEPC